MHRKHMRNAHIRVRANAAKGRDFVAGDVHGQFQTLERALAGVDFNAERDRLLSVGDLIDRGPDSAQAIEWMRSGRITLATRGNHEQWLLERLEAEAYGEEDIEWRRQGWFDTDVARTSRPRWAEMIAAMPIAATIETAHGDIGIVHAAPVLETWASTIDALNSGDPDAGWLSLNSCARATGDRHRAKNEGVPITGDILGVRAIITGHNPDAKPHRTGNVWHIDTRAGFENGAVTLARIDANEIETFTVTT